MCVCRYGNTSRELSVTAILHDTTLDCSDEITVGATCSSLKFCGSVDDTLTWYLESKHAGVRISGM